MTGASLSRGAAGEPLTAHSDGKLPPEVQERGREIVAERLGWPEEALARCQGLEEKHPRWYSWWTPFPYPDPGFSPAYGARLVNGPAGDSAIYARTPDELAELIETENARRGPGWPGA